MLVFTMPRGPGVGESANGRADVLSYLPYCTEYSIQKVESTKLRARGCPYKVTVRHARARRAKYSVRYSGSEPTERNCTGRCVSRRAHSGCMRWPSMWWRSHVPWNGRGGATAVFPAAELSSRHGPRRSSRWRRNGARRLGLSGGSGGAGRMRSAIDNRHTWLRGRVRLRHASASACPT